MTVNGIIAEYNPFHNGHKYQLEESLRLTGADYTIVVMSGNFVQRGAPALADKSIRTEMALRCGADLVLELPVLYASSSAEYFAAGAVALLDSLGIVTHICFGSECGNTETLAEIAGLLLEEPEEYRAALKNCIKQGLSYPSARTRALSLINPPFSKTGEDLSVILSCPNNILGIEYIRELHRRRSSIRPFTIKRIGSGYHDEMETAGACPDRFPGNSDDNVKAHCQHNDFGNELPCSAYAIRQTLYQGGQPLLLERYMPWEAASLLTAWLEKRRPLCSDDFSTMLYYKLLTEKKYGYEKYLDLSPGLSDRIKKSLGQFTGFEAFCDLLKTKNITHARISRCLLHILLDIKKEDMSLGKSLGHTPYARILGFQRSAGPLLGALKAHASVPLISKLADAKRILPPDAARLLEKDILAGDIYKGALYAGTGCTAPNEYTTPLVIL